jgi:hypothetical protein
MARPWPAVAGSECPQRDRRPLGAGAGRVPVQRRVAGDDGVHYAGTEDHPFEERVRCQSVRPVNARASGLARRPQVRERRGAVEIGEHAAAQVMSCRRHREPVAGRVEADIPERPMDGREPLGKILETGAIEPHILGAGIGELAGDGSAHDIARRQLLHESPAALGPQDCAVPAQGFGNEGTRHGWMVQGGRVELHELGVGHRHARPHRHGDPVACRLGRVRRDSEQLAGTPAGEENVCGLDADDAACRVERKHARAAPVLDEEVEREPVLEDGGGARLDRSHEGALHFGPCGHPAGVEDPRHRVTTLAGAGQAPRRAAIEHGPEGDQLVDAGRALVDEHADGRFVAQSAACPQRVGEMQVGRVLVTGQHGCDAALRPPRRRLLELTLREHPDAGLGEPSQPNGGREAGDPAPDDEHVETTGHVLGVPAAAVAVSAESATAEALALFPGL